MIYLEVKKQVDFHGDDFIVKIPGKKRFSLIISALDRSIGFQRKHSSSMQSIPFELTNEIISSFF